MRDLSNDRVQTLRGLACLLLVSFHVIGHDTTSGIGVSPSSWYRDFTNFFIHIRMPLFIFLSGFVYAYKPARDLKVFASKKLQRLAVPFILVSAIYFTGQQITGDSKLEWVEMWRIYLLPYAHFWFLQAAMVLFTTLAILDHFRFLDRLSTFAAFFIFILFGHFFTEVTDWLGFKEAMDLAPFFFAGVALNRFHDQLIDTNSKRSIAALFGLLMTVHIVSTMNGYVAPKGSYFGTTLSLFAVATLIYYIPPAKWLAWIGAYSFTIYLYHVFFSSPFRTVLYKIGVTNLEIHFVFGCLIAIAGPILMEMVLRHSAITCKLLLGQPGKSHAKTRTIPADTDIAVSTVR